MWGFWSHRCLLPELGFLHTLRAGVQAGVGARTSRLPVHIPPQRHPPGYSRLTDQWWCAAAGTFQGALGAHAAPAFLTGVEAYGG